jgi:hypothetical protein
MDRLLEHLNIISVIIIFLSHKKYTDANISCLLGLVYADTEYKNYIVSNLKKINKYEREIYYNYSDEMCYSKVQESLIIIVGIIYKTIENNPNIRQSKLS